MFAQYVVFGKNPRTILYLISSSSLFAMSATQLKYFPDITFETFAVCSCEWRNRPLYFTDHEPMTNTVECWNRNNRMCKTYNHARYNTKAMKIKYII